MSPFTHALLAWLVAAVMIKDLRDRRLVVLAGILSDLDGVFVLFNEELFYTYHHTLGHSFVFGIPLALGLGLLAKNRKRTTLAALAAFSVHLVADIVGGNWPVYLFYPISGFGMTIVDHVSNEVIYNAINPAVFLLGLLAMLLVGYRKEITPVEFFSQNLDQKIVSIVVYPFKYKCGICGKWAFVKCVVCEGKVCYRHIESLSQENKRFSGFFTFDRWRCSKCAKEGLSPD